MKYFVISDIHSFYKEMKAALDQAGYDEKNPDHFLIVCGDIFDRGEQSKRVLNFLKRIPKKRKALIRGNHEYLLKKAIYEIEHLEEDRDYIADYHYSNGTIKTICHLSDVKYEGYYWTNPYDILQHENDNKTIHKIIDWTMSDDWVDYYEVGDFIFVHCWIPVIDHDNLPMYYTRNRNFEFDPNWKDRKACGYEWEEATWGCPYVLNDMNLRPDGKTIVCGHWHTSDFHNHYAKKDDNIYQENYEIYYGHNLIALDACTAYSKFCNVLVIDENGKCFDKYGKELKEN